MSNIKIIKVDREKAPWDLLLMADPSKKSVANCLKKGSCFAAFQEKEIVGTYILVKKNSTMEIANIAVSKKNQGRGIGKLMIKDAIKQSKKMKIKRIIVVTGNSSISQIAFYQKCGFRIFGVKNDYFVKR